VLAYEAMAVVAIRLVRAGATPAKSNTRFLGDQSSVPIDQSDPTAHVEGAEVSGANGRHLVGFFVGESFVRFVLERPRRTETDRFGNLIRVGTVYFDPRASGDIEHCGKGHQTFGYVGASGRVPHNG
jgi:hypothetical protein